MTIAIITARGGSKGLKRKNILDFNGKPLIAWTIEAALNSKVIDGCYVTTEDNEIARVASTYGAKIIERPLELAGNLTSSDDVLVHALQAVDSDFETVVLLQPTSPLRTGSDIKAALSIFKEKNAGCVISVFEPKYSAAKSYKLEESGEISGLYSKDAPYTPRQKLPKTLQPNGAIYIFKKDNFFENNQIPRDKIYPYIMAEELSIDIDDINDFKQAEIVMRNLK